MQDYFLEHMISFLEIIVTLENVEKMKLSFPQLRNMKQQSNKTHNHINNIYHIITLYN